MPKNRPINLLPQEEFDTSIVGRVLKWAMGTFRIIVIVTEMIVMAAFLSRFWLDAQNSDLNDSIKVKTAQITTQADFEKEFRNIQSKLSIFKSLSQFPKPSDQILLVSSKLPQEVILSGINVQTDSIQVKGSSGNEIGIAQFISNLKAEKKFKSVDLGQLNSSENSSSSIFIINIKY